MKRRTKSLLSSLLIALVPVLGAVACTDDAGPTDNSAPFLGQGKWALHVQVGIDRHTVDFVPDAAGRSGGSATSPEPHPQGIKLLGAPNAVLPTAPASALLYAAAVECKPEIASELVIPASGNNAGSVLDPWSSTAPLGSWFIFRNAPTRCDDVMRDEQILMCMADKLAEVSDTVNVVKWDVGSLFATNSSNTSLPGPWQILPQSDLDRFISRDLAIYTLANLAQLDGSKLSFLSGGSGGPYFSDDLTCADAFARARANNVWAASYSGQLFTADFHVTEYLGQTLYNNDPTTIRTLVDQRLELETHTLRAGARMTHDLIEQSVYADLAGAAHRAGQASDPLRANKETWGDEDPYDSLAHAMRVLAGRWDGNGRRVLVRNVGWTWDTTATPLGVLAGLGYYGTGFREVPIRELDLPISRQGQADAAKLIQHAGIVADAGAVAVGDAGASSSLRDMLKQQLLIVAAIASKAIDLNASPVNCALPAGFETTPEGLRVGEALAPLSDADLRFGLNYAARTFQLITRDPYDSYPFQALAWETTMQALPPACIAPLLQPIGTVILGGIGRDFLPNDITPRALEAIRTSTKFGAQSAAKDWGLAATAKPNPVIFQDSFGIARAFFWRLGVMQSLTSGFGPDFVPQKTSLDAVAEMRPWTGGGTVYVDASGSNCAPSAIIPGGGPPGPPAPPPGPPPAPPPPSPCTTYQQYTIRLEGFLPSDLGVDSYDRLVGNLALTDDAECSMRLRPDCPVPPSESNVPASWMTWDAAHLLVTITLPTNTYLNRWLFSRHSKTNGGPAFVAPLESASVYQDSPMRRELFKAMFKFADGERAHDPRIGDRGTGQSDAYCIPGVSRDMFVPLSNELTSTGSQFEDSWKHYVDVARQAAQRADDLAQKIIDVGVQQDTRREAAAEKLGQICGDISALDQVAVNGDGTINAGAADDSLKQCMSEPRCDVVFLATRDLKASPVSVSELLSLLHCSTNGGASDLCKRLSPPNAPTVVDCLKAEPAQFGDPNTIKVSSLNLYDLKASPAEASCKSVDGQANELRGGGFNPSGSFDAMLSEAWTSPDRLKTLAYRVQMRVSPLNATQQEIDRTGAWSVVAGPTVLMSTDDAPQGTVYWPSCLRNPSTCDFAHQPGLRRFNKIFRSTCNGGDREVCALGAPEGGDERAEINTLRWRVQGALWTLGMLGGAVPPAMFTTPLPAVDLNGVPVGTQPPVSAIYGGSCFNGGSRLVIGSSSQDPPGSPNCVNSTQADSQMVGDTSPVFGTRFTVWGPSVGALPYWYSDIFVKGAAYYRLIPGVQNAEEPGQSGDIPTIVSGLGGTKCADYYGNGGSPSSDDFISRLDGLKGSWDTGDRLAASGQWGDRFTPSGGAPTVTWLGCGYHVNGFDRFVGAMRKDRPIDVTCADPSNPYPPNQIGCEFSSERGIDCFGFESFGHYSYWADEHLNTSVAALPPEKRARTFLNAGAPPDVCGGLSELLGAYAMACSTGELAPVDTALGAAPVVNTEADLVRFRRWLATLEVAVKDRGAHFFAQGVPVRAVQDQVQGQVTRGSLKGDHGDAIIGIETGLGNVGNDWVAIATSIHSLNGDLDKTQAIITGIKDAKDSKIRDLSLGLAKAMIADSSQGLQGAIQLVRGIGEIALSAETAGASGVAGVADLSSGANSVVSANANSTTDLASYNAQVDAANSQAANQIYQNLLTLSQSATETIGALQKGVTSLRTDVNNVSSTADKLRREQEMAAYYAAQGLGADYVTTPDGVTTTIPLNTVLRRQFDGTRTRYAQALRDARALAFIARRAVEQRLGVSLMDLHDAIGPLEAPATWADSVCHMTGIDYSQLRGIGATVDVDGGDAGTTINLEPATGDGGFDRAAIDAYAGGFIGDYVAKLQNFVDYYNVQYPSHQSDDIAILSLREDFLRAPNACIARGANLLHYSSQLNVQAEGDPLNHGRAGWEYHPCVSASKCLRATESLGDPDGVAPQDAVRARVTLLADQAIPGNGSPDAGTGGARDPRGRVVSNAPPGLVSQAVQLDAGAYVLSW